MYDIGARKNIPSLTGLIESLDKAVTVLRHYIHHSAPSDDSGIFSLWYCTVTLDPYPFWVNWFS